ncbi:hypothetical protein ACQKQD_31415 [Methylobacterium sp. NPDC080182]|uniref:hypothetical protein n=1 Tax=Methylobacterium sp. NPDC080182 TaxID=3390590 RepID=UPI003CFDE5DC
MALAINLTFVILTVSVVSYILRVYPAGLKAVVVVSALDVCMVALAIWVNTAFRSALAAILLICFIGPLIEECTRYGFRTVDARGIITSKPISQVLGGIEAIEKGLRLNVSFNPNYLAIDHLAIHALLATLITVLFQANVGILWDRRAVDQGAQGATFEMFLLHGSYNFVVLATEPPTLGGKVTQGFVLLALQLACFVLMIARSGSMAKVQSQKIDPP